MLAGCGMLAGIACQDDHEQAIRHVVIAEFIEREKVTEEHVEIIEVRIEAPRRAEVKVRVTGTSGRASVPLTFRCRLTHDSGRWSVRAVQPE